MEAILTRLVLAKLAGMKTPAAVARWVRYRAELLKVWLPWKRKSFPCASTYSNMLRTLDVEQLSKVLAQFLTRAEAQQRCGDEPSRLSSDERGQLHRHLASLIAARLCRREQCSPTYALVGCQALARRSPALRFLADFYIALDR